MASKTYLTLFRNLILVILTGLLFGSPAHSAANKDAHSVYHVPLASEPNTLDPAFITSTYAVNVAMNIFDGLVEFDKDLNILPAIARRWIIDREHRVYTFFLRDDVKFHNGRQVTADDFVYSFTRILSPETKSPVAALFSHIHGARDFCDGKAASVSGLSAPDPYTLQIRLEEPYAPFLSILATANAKVVPREVVDSDFGIHPVGTGPFRFYKWEKGNEILLTANYEYFFGKPSLEYLNFHIFTNDQWEDIFADFEKRLVDHAIIPKSQYDEITSSSQFKKKYNIVSSPGLNLVYIGMNQTVPPFNDLRIRQAMSYGIDFDSIVRLVTKGGSVRARGILPRGIAGYDPSFHGYGYNPKKARELLAEAGYPDGHGLPAIEILTVSKSETVRNELLAYQQYLSDIGIHLEIRVAADWKEFTHLINNKLVPMFYAAWYADYPDPDNFLYVLCHSESPTNRMGYHNPVVDEKLEAARAETNYLERVAIYREIEKLVIHDAPILCQHTNSFNVIVQPWIKGLELGYLGPSYIQFRDIRIEDRPMNP